MNPLTVAVLVFLGIVSIVAAIGLAVRDAQAAHRRAERDAAARPRLQRIPQPQAVAAGEGFLAAFDQWFVQLLRDAGLDWSPIAAALLVVLWGTLCGVALFVWDERLAPAFLAGLLATPLPFVYWIFLRERRLTKLQDQLPSALETMARSMRAGRTLDEAIGLLGDHSPEPLAKEFRWCAQQMGMGLALPAVMRSLMQRVRLYDLRIVANTLTVHRQTGGNVVLVLERLAQVIHDRLNYRRQLRATTAAGRMSAGLFGVLAPGVFLYLFFFRPDYVGTMLQSPLGQMLLLLAVVLEIVGLVWVYLLLRPAY